MYVKDNSKILPHVECALTRAHEYTSIKQLAKSISSTMSASNLLRAIKKVLGLSMQEFVEQFMLTYNPYRLHREWPAARKYPRGSRYTYTSWRCMKNRCHDPEHKRYKSYGGRGITVCERWLSFENFLMDMGPRPQGMTLDRTDSTGNYEPDNCRWATPTEQQANRRVTSVSVS